MVRVNSEERQEIGAILAGIPYYTRDISPEEYRLSLSNL